MWYVLIAEIAFLSVFTIVNTPRKWFKNKLFLLIFIIFHLIGISSVIVLLWFFYRLDNPIIKNIVLIIETSYFTFNIFAFGLSLYRSFIFYATRHNKNKKLRDKMLSPVVFWSIVIVLSTLYLIPGLKNADNIIKKTYHIESNKIDRLKIAMVSDLHIGAGASNKNVDDMVKIINDMNADCLLICGDIVDSSSSIDDLEYLKQSLCNINTKYGIYAVEGNHDEQCRYNIKQYLLEVGVTCLHNESSLINKNIAIVGLCDKLDENVKEIKDENKINDVYTIVLQHKPKNFKNIQNDTDLVLCGHTHGYQYPFVAVTTPLFFEMRQGIKQFDQMTAITSCGVSQWGYHSKWPSQSEVVEIIIN